MKDATKYILTLTLALLVTSVADARVKKIYRENYESQTDASSWASTNAAASLSLVTGDETYGNYILFSPGTANDRSAQTYWYSNGNDFYEDVRQYTLEFDANIKSGNNHFTTELAVMAEGGSLKANQNYRNNNSGEKCLFDLTNTTDAGTYIVNGDQSNTIQLPQSQWMHFKLDIDADAKTVTYAVTLVADQSQVTSGTLTIADDAYKAQGLYFLAGRYYAEGRFDNISITTYVEGDVANDPKIELVKIDGTKRIYSITYGEDETLHYTLPGQTEELTHEGGGTIEVETSESGTLSAYTTSGTARSQTVSVEVSAENISLATPYVTITSIDAGFKRTYSFGCDNSEVPLMPQATLSYVFEPTDGSQSISGEAQNSATLSVNQSGILRITASADGYTSSETTVENVQPYKKAFDYNFASMTIDELSSNPYLTVGEAFTDSRWGWTDHLNYQLTSDDEAASAAFPGITLFTNKTPTIYAFAGLMAPLYDANGTSISLNGEPLTITNGQADEYAVFTVSENYGASTSTQVKEATESFQLYRFSSLLTRVQLFVPNLQPAGISETTAAESHETMWYNLQGQPIAHPTARGIYIKNGKKVVVGK